LAKETSVVSRTIFALSATLMLLLLYLFTVEIPRGKKEEVAVPNPPLLSFSPETVTRLTLRKIDSDDIVLARSSAAPDDLWRLTAPIDAAADPVAVASFLSQVSELRASKTVDAEPEGVKPYGLDPPAYTLLMAVDGADPGVDQELLDIGVENPNQMGHYARKGIGSPVWIVPSGLVSFFERGPDEWRDRRLFEDFQKMEGRVEAMVIEKTEGITRWAKPEQAEQIEQILNHLRRLRVDTFLEDPNPIPTPGILLRLLGKEDDLLGEITVGPLDGENVQAKAPAQPAPFLLRQSDVESLFAPLAPSP
jgi:hypothetical protein